jgi:hypothetical protein
MKQGNGSLLVGTRTTSPTSYYIQETMPSSGNGDALDRRNFNLRSPFAVDGRGNMRRHDASAARHRVHPLKWQGIHIIHAHGAT